MADHCEEGACTGNPVLCEDGNLCTDDECDGAGGCVFTDNSDDCDDDNPCTVADKCIAGECKGVDVSCDCQTDEDCLQFEDGDLCNGTLFCNLEEWPYECAVAPETVVQCEEPVPGPDVICLKSSCDPTTGQCSMVPDHEGFPCEDGDACTIGDKCTAGACIPGVPTVCADNNPCTDDTCDAAAGCVYTDNVLPCEDGNICTTMDLCAGGECQSGKSLVCNDDNACTDDACDPALGCLFVANDAACDDGVACTLGDHCADGECTYDELESCDDENPCSDNYCDPAKGCIATVNEALCDDHDLCTIGDHCQQGVCAFDEELLCDDFNSCTDDVCDPEQGCVFTMNEAPCDDFDACTVGETCVTGVCGGGQPMECDDGDDCTADSCDAVLGCRYETICVGSYNLQCSGCISPEEVDFNYASSDAPGGAATSALTANEALTATSALTANEALVANNVACAGCITLQAIDAAVLTAENIGYDNAVSGLPAITAQDAIDENALAIAAHMGDAEIHGGGDSGNDGAKVRVVPGDVDVVPGQTATEYIHVFSADTPKVHLYAYGMASSVGDAGAVPTGGGTIVYTRCAWIGSHAKNASTCTPPDCPNGWQNLGVTGNAKTGATTSGSSITHTSYSAAYGFQERACFNAASYPVVQPRCHWTGSHGKDIKSCTPPACPANWADLGVTGKVVSGGATSGSSITHTSYSTTAGYQERTCINQVNSEIPQGVQIWVDGVDRTAAIGDQQGVGAPAWTGSAWGADGTTPWATGRLDISQVSDWGVGEHALQFKTTGESGGKLKYYVYLVDPAAQSQAFPNDACGGAEALVFNGGIAQVNATTEDMLGENKALDNLSPADCGGQGGGDVVYEATIEERSTIKASVAAPFVTRLYILDSPCQDESVLACGTTQATTAELDPGTYYVVVDSDAADQTGDFGLTVELEASPLPANDTCDGVESINAGQQMVQVTGTTKWGLDQYSGTCGGDGTSDVVYSFQASNQNDDLLVTINAPFSPVMILRAQDCQGGFQLSCSTNGTIAIQGLAPGLYYLIVDGVAVEDEGEFTLDVTLN